MFVVYLYGICVCCCCLCVRLCEVCPYESSQGWHDNTPRGGIVYVIGSTPAPDCLVETKVPPCTSVVHKPTTTDFTAYLVPEQKP